jgi:hypothetical protein
MWVCTLKGPAVSQVMWVCTLKGPAVSHVMWVCTLKGPAVSHVMWEVKTRALCATRPSIHDVVVRYDRVFKNVEPAGVS